MSDISRFIPNKAVFTFYFRGTKLNLFVCRIQCGQYEDSYELLSELLKIEEGSLGARTDELADIYQLMAKTKSEVREEVCNE